MNPMRASLAAALALTAAVLTPAPLAAQASPTRAHVETLASPPLAGRLAGSEGERLASDYLAADLRKLGAKPLSGSDSFLRPFEFTAGTLERANVAAGFDLAVQADPYQPTDVATFNAAGVPSLSFFTGTHADYHKPSDTADKIDYEDFDRVAGFAAAIVRRIDALPEPPAFAKVDERLQQGAGRAGVRVFTGTVPDYSTDVKGLLLGGVVGGGPAEQAGLRTGDVIVEIAGQTIANIYDYAYALDVLKIGQPVKVVYTRDGRRLETTLTPAARK